MQTVSSPKGQPNLSKIFLFAKELHIYRTQQPQKLPYVGGVTICPGMMLTSTQKPEI